jgi:thiamine biosynthesis lipoprotein
VDWRKVELDREAKTLRLAAAGMRLDLGAIAKGFAADEARRILMSAGVKAAIVDLGGNIYALGEKRDGSPWRIGIQVPRPESEVQRGVYLGVIEGRDITLVTSGVYERFFEKDGLRYHHILDLGTGYPVRNGLVSVTIVSGTSADADALSTSIFALGKRRGLELAERLGGVAVVMVDEDGRIDLSPSARGMFTLTSEDYALSD